MKSVDLGSGAYRLSCVEWKWDMSPCALRGLDAVQPFTDTINPNVAREMPQPAKYLYLQGVSFCCGCRRVSEVTGNLGLTRPPLLLTDHVTVYDVMRRHGPPAPILDKKGKQCRK